MSDPPQVASQPSVPQPPLTKQRLDVYLVDQGLCDSRQQAQRVIRAGEVQVNHQVIDKPGTVIKVGATVRVKQKAPYVSRGGEKLAKALAEFDVSTQGRVCLDGGISTGGFTDCLLQQGAEQVYGIDVGYGQVAWKLRQDPRVILRERTNLRHLTPADLYADGHPRPDLGVIDVSFISLTKVLTAFGGLLTPSCEAILLVKPQFEVGKEKIGKKGVVRDPKDQAVAIWQVWQSAATQGWQHQGLTYSPLLGPAGNVEYLLWIARPQAAGSAADARGLDLATITQLTQTACQTLR
ncbi:MAG: TlyA family RNA methyltransferase [Cyanobacteria bacterium P01_A01_bin.105]